MQMFRRSTILADATVPLAVLKERVCVAVETEIQNEISDFDITDEEYIDISSKFWERFYSCCEQYHCKSVQPIGLVLQPSMGSICIVKKSSFSLLRPCDLLEHLMLFSRDVDQGLDSGEVLAPTPQQDIVRLVAVLVLLEAQMPDELKRDIHDRLYQLQMPNVVVEALISDMLSTEYDDTVCFFFSSTNGSKMLIRNMFLDFFT